MAIELSQSFTEQIFSQQAMSQMNLYGNGQGGTQTANNFPNNAADILCDSL